MLERLEDGAKISKIVVKNDDCRRQTQPHHNRNDGSETEQGCPAKRNARMQLPVKGQFLERHGVVVCHTAVYYCESPDREYFETRACPDVLRQYVWIPPIR